MEKDNSNKLTISFSKDLSQIKESVFWGFSLKEVSALVSSLVIALIIWVLFKYVLKFDNPYVMYIALPFVIPILLNGFYIRCGLTFKERVRKKKSIKNMGILLWKSSDNIENFVLAEKYLKEHLIDEANKQRSEYMFDKSAKKIKIIVTIAIIACLAFVACAIIIKKKILS